MNPRILARLFVFSWGLTLGLGVGCEKKEERSTGNATVNRPPLIWGVHITPLFPMTGQPLRAQVRAVDPDGDQIYLSYRWKVNGVEVPGEDQEEFPGGLLRPGDRVSVVVAAHDGKAWGEELTSVPVTISSPPLTKLSVALHPEIVFPGDTVKASISEGPEGFWGMRLLFRWRVNEEMVLEGAEDEFPLEGLKRGDRIQVEVVIQEGEEVKGRGFSKILIVQNRPPEIISRPPQRLTQPGLYRYRVKAIDPDGDELTFRLEGEVPSGMRIDPRTGVLEWGFSQFPTQKVKVDIRANDGHGGEARQIYELLISEAGGS